MCFLSFFFFFTILIRNYLYVFIVCVCVCQRMSQFWYSDETATKLAEEVVREAGEGGR